MRRAPFLAACAAIALSVAVVAAPQNPPPPGRPPARPAPAPMTAVIAGQVVTAASNSPVRAAQVHAHSDDGLDRLVTTAADGRFELRNLPAGRWTLAVTKAGFLTQRFGQRRPFGASTPIDVSVGQRVSANFVLARAGAITGRVFDEFGEPIVGARVRALRSQMRDGRRFLQQVGPVDESDDLGAFRVYDLPAGDYYMSAARRVAPVDSPNETTFAPTFFPGTAIVQDALRVSLGPGEEQTASFQLLPVRFVPVSGRVLHADSTPADAYVNLIASTADGAAANNIGAMTERDGSFVIANAAPGEYVLSATVLNQAGPGERGTVPVTVGDGGLTGITLFTSRGALMSITIDADAGVTTPLPVTQFRITAQAVPPDMPASMMGITAASRPGQVLSNLRLGMPGLIGRLALRVEGLPPEWMVKSVTINDAIDATDAPFEFRGEQPVSAHIVLTDRVTDVAGAVTSGTLTSDATVVIFPDDRAQWAFPSRYVRWTKLDADGGFRLRALPPDTQYLAVAVDYMEENEAQDPAFLENLRMRATRFTLREGGIANLMLRLLTR